MNTPTNPSTEIAAADTVDDDAFDAEILEIFIEEGQGEVANIGENLALWRTDLTDSDAYSAIRRSFHTLKGDSRLVAQMELGEFAWSYEQLMNLILKGKLTPDQTIIDAVADAHQVFASVFQDIDNFDARDPALTTLAKRAEAIMNGEPVVEAPVVEAPVVEEIASEEPEYQSPRTTTQSRVVLWVLLLLLVAALAGYYYLN